MYRNAYAGAKKYKAGISPPVRRVSRQATGGSRGDVVTVSHLRHLVTLPGATGCGYVMYQRGGGAARSTPNITSLGVWRTMRAALPSRPLSSPPPAGWAAGAGPGLRGAVAGQDRSALRPRLACALSCCRLGGTCMVTLGPLAARLAAASAASLPRDPYVAGDPVEPDTPSLRDKAL
ncbi:hypothetical protein GWK47_021121 [Chionoecetes opilio]|uniref:Uncharacterized protein n=1 Tax=Chionoecetes opilio TaxID=41210 RepID=A0A8J4XNR7_CHIOP|nr:hypothetical protein GWK47_021121 [Chionoecetes opilio]